MTDSLRVKNLSLSIDSCDLLKNISFTLRKGEKLAVLGFSGSGKSLLIETIAAGKPSAGSVEFSKFINKKNCTFSYDQFGALSLLKVKEVKNLLSKIYSWPEDNELFKRFHLNEIENTPIGLLSKGEKKRLGVYSSLFSNPEIVILDEPTDGLDPIFRDVLWEIISNIKSSVMITTHLWEEAEKFQDKVALMYDGAFLSEPTSMNKILESLPYEGKVVTDCGFESDLNIKVLHHDKRNFYFYKNFHERDKVISEINSSPAAQKGYSILPVTLVDAYLLHIRKMGGSGLL